MVIDCRPIAKQWKENMKQEVANFGKDNVPSLCVFVAKDYDKASSVYVKNKSKACEEVGIHQTTIEFNWELWSEEYLINQIDLICKQGQFDGVMVQLPLPPKYNVRNVVNAIHPNCDVDGLTETNMGKFVCSKTNDGDFFIPCTTLGVLKICKSLRLNLYGVNISVLGRSNIVGKPTAIAFEHENASVTILHSHSLLYDIRRSVSESDIVVSAIGKAGILNKFINANSVIIDCGFSFKDGHSCGDFDPSQVSETTLKQMSYTPTPHGTGVLTVCGLLENTIKAFKKRNKLK